MNKPTKEQLVDAKWWDENSNGFDYVYETGPEWDGDEQCKGSIRFAGEFGVTSVGGRLVLGEDSWVLLAERPKLKIENETDWLVVGGEVLTPKGKAEVCSITEDNGVNTSLGNFCRSELSEIATKWVPKVGEWCEAAIDLGELHFNKIKINYISDDVCVYELNNKECVKNTASFIFRPLKTQREELIEIIKANLEANVGLSDIAGVILAKYELTEKGW